jgi:CBS domain containing-hemolysin-like protein
LLPSWPPGIPPLGFPVPSPLGALGSNVGLVAWLLAAEALVVFATISAVAIEHYSRSRVLTLAKQRGVAAQTERRLDHVGAYELSARLVRFLGTALLVVGIAAISLGDETVGPASLGFPWSAVATAVGIAFLVLFAVNDILVQIAARRRPNHILCRVLPGLEVLRWLTAPIRLPLTLIARFVFRVQLEEPESTAREEVLESVEEGEREGSLTADEADMIESIIDLDGATADDVCTPRGEIAMVSATARIEDAARFMIERGHRRVPAYGKDRDDILGIVYSFDLLAQLTQESRHRTVHEVMRSPFFVPEGKPLNDLLSEMRARRVSLAVVLNEFGGTSGVVTIEDVLEEIVGEIEDEHDRSSPPVKATNGVIVVEGRTAIEDVNEALSTSLPVEEDFETVGGLVFHRMGKVPRVGDRVSLDGVTLTVTEADERTVKRLRVELGADADARS